MKFQLPLGYRRPLYAFSWILSVSSVVLAFFTLSFEISILLAVVGFAFPIFLEKTLFRYNILWVPPFSLVFTRQIATCWFEDEVRGRVIPGFGIVFEKREDAKEAYQTIRSWNYGAYIDREQNVNLTIVKETQSKFSIFLYAGDRERTRTEIEDQATKLSPSNVEAKVEKILKLWMRSCADYKDRAHIIRVIEAVSRENDLLVNTFYVHKNRIKQYAKSSLCLKRINFVQRENLSVHSLEYNYPWIDSLVDAHDNAERIKHIQLY